VKPTPVGIRRVKEFKDLRENYESGNSGLPIDSYVYTTYQDLLRPKDTEDGEDSGDKTKNMLTPWIPINESAVRIISDEACITEKDIHVDLGSGDGRVCFITYDYAEVKSSTGIDIDEKMVQLANDRLKRRHPQPQISFILGDLMNPNDPCWAKVQEATVITMFFTPDGLAKLRPILEMKMMGKVCRIVTINYGTLRRP
jgi:SAM-dependent methyltransferase